MPDPRRIPPSSEVVAQGVSHQWTTLLGNLPDDEDLAQLDDDAGLEFSLTGSGDLAIRACGAVYVLMGPTTFRVRDTPSGEEVEGFRGGVSVGAPADSSRTDDPGEA